MPRSKSPLLESLLALLANRERAAAIYGDLLELSALRPRSAFWIGYLRTLLGLSVRPLLAFVTAASVFAFLYDRLALLFFFFAMGLPHIGESLANVGLQLCFLVPFAAIQYGVRDRAVRATIAAALALICVFTLGLYFPLTELWLAFALIGIIFAIALTRWRTAIVPMAASCLVGVLVTETAWHIQNAIPVIPVLKQLSPVLPLCLDILVVPVIFSWTRGRLFPSPTAGGAHA